MTGWGVMLIKLRYVHRDVDRHGNVRIYFQRKGERKVRLHEPQGSEAFYKRYHELLQQSPPAAGPGKPCCGPPAGTYKWLCEEYMRSAGFKRLDASTQTVRRRILESTYAELIRPGSTNIYADLPLKHLTAAAVRVLRDRKAATPGAASNRVKAVRVALGWAVENELLAFNPARDVKAPFSSEGHHTWTIEEVRQFETRHEVGSKARLALALLLWTGVRRSDVVLLGRQHARGGWLKFMAGKNKVTVEIPILPQLQRVIEQSPCGDLTYLVTEKGQPFTANGFGNWFGERCGEAGVPGRAHGLRKAGAATAAENGATPQQLMSIFGWLTLKEAERYARAARRRKMAAEAMGMLVRKDE